MATKPGKTRLDVLLVERGLASSRERAQALLLAGAVLVNGQKMGKAGSQVAANAQVELVGDQPRFVSRGGEKLEGALEDLGISPEGRTCADIGSSTGGFTDCLLQRGAKKVYAVDVTARQMDWKLQQDSRVTLIDINARYIKPEELPERVDLVVMDVSFISATKVLPAVAAIAEPEADLLILVKPQFELERGDVGKGGIVRDPALHEKAIERAKEAARSVGLEIVGAKPSRIAGAEGNQEFFLHVRRRG
jgi:23S rRNA (cytidine1920-2'-O)/16S rRNA (cytidine1409-2'-O)-methyltransferase